MPRPPSRPSATCSSRACTTAGFTTTTPAAGYFVVADAAPLGRVFSEAGGGAGDAAAFCRELPALAGVVAVPVTAFVRPEHRAQYATLVRFAFCKRVDVLEQAVRQLSALPATTT